MIKNVAFVAREYVQDDEVTDGRDGLFDEFGGDAFYVSFSPTLLGFGMGNDGYELCLNEERPRDMSRYIILADYQDLSHEEMRRTREAVAEAIALQKFFRAQKEAEELKAEHEAAMRAADEALAEAHKAFLSEACELFPDELDVVEMVVVVNRPSHKKGGCTVNNTYRPWIRRKNGRPLGHRGSSGANGRFPIPELHPVAVVFDDGTTLRVG